MKIVSWNCNGAFRNKYEFISEYNADIYVIQECENPAESKNNDYIKWANNYLWNGDSKNKGLGVFAKQSIDLQMLPWSNEFKDHLVKHFLPCKINNEFDLLAVWTHKNNSPNFGYIGQFWKYLQTNKHNLKSSIIVGDFNSNSKWDQWDRWWNHSDVVNELRELGIESLYHFNTGEQQGNESKPTLYFQRNLQKPYHIDYIFAPQKWQSEILKLEVGTPNQWLQHSDHMPIFVEFNSKKA